MSPFPDPSLSKGLWWGLRVYYLTPTMWPNLLAGLPLPPPPLPNVTEVLAALGLANYYRMHVCGFAEIVNPMFHLTRTGRAFQWTSECEAAFQKLKQVLISPEIMPFPQDEGQYYLDTDACDINIGAVLSRSPRRKGVCSILWKLHRRKPERI